MGNGRSWMRLEDLQWPELHVEMVLVNPVIAAFWLKQNSIKTNRTLRKNKITQMVRDMKGKQWHQIGDAVKFARETGVLLDGQHRLQALCEAGVTLPMLVVFGVDPEAQTVMDTGTKRTNGDALHLKGIANPNTVAAIVRRMLLMERGRGETSGAGALNPTTTEVVDYVTMHQEMVQDASLVAQRIARSVPMGPSTAGVGYLLAKEKDAEQAREFFTMLEKGTSLGDDHPVWALRERLIKNKMRKTQTDEREQVVLLIRAWNAYREGRTLSRLVYNPGDEMPQVR